MGGLRAARKFDPAPTGASYHCLETGDWTKREATEETIKA
jgi:hypothetical protein